MDEAARQSAASLNLRRPVCLGKSVDFQKLFVFELNFGRMCFFCNQLSCAMNFISCDNNFKQRLGNPSVIAQKAPLCTFEATGRASHNWLSSQDYMQGFGQGIYQLRINLELENTVKNDCCTA